MATFALTSTFQQVGTQGKTVVVQNKSSDQATLQTGTSAPATGTDGILLGPGERIILTLATGNNLYAASQRAPAMTLEVMTL